MKTIQRTATTPLAKTATACKLLADGTRLKILCLLFSRGSGAGVCVSEIAETIGISHSAASHQLAKLEARGIVRSWREGQTVCYELCDIELTRNIGKVLHIFGC